MVWSNRPAEQAAADARDAAAAEVAAACAAGSGNHDAEVMAHHPGRPTESEAIGRGVTPSSGGA